MAAKKNERVSQLRAEARARHTAATRKVARLRSKGVQVVGTKYDVRRPSAKIDKLNSIQLAAYITKLNSFVDRKTQFVGDVHGRPIPATLYREYKATERQINNTVNKAYEQIKDINLPGQNRTIDDRMQAITPKHKHAGNAANSPYLPVVRNPENFASEKKLKEMIAKNKKRLKTDFLAKDLKRDREVVRVMANTLGRPDLAYRVKKLTNDQFNILFNFWGFINKLGLPYEVAQARIRDKKDRAELQDNLDRNLKEAERLLGHAEKIQLGS